MTIQQRSRFVTWSTAVLGCMLLVACHNRQPAVPVPPPQTAPPVVVRTAPPAPAPRESPPMPPVTSPRAPTEEEIFARTSLAELNAKEPLDDTFFAYDRSELSESARASLQRDANWLRRWSGTRVMVEGHADERGTNEYNLALGERRAAVTRDYLVSLGIDPSRIAIVSKGREAPFCREQNERCWQQNRRGHFIVTAK